MELRARTSAPSTSMTFPVDMDFKKTSVEGLEGEADATAICLALFFVYAIFSVDNYNKHKCKIIFNNSQPHANKWITSLPSPKKSGD